MFGFNFNKKNKNCKNIFPVRKYEDLLPAPWESEVSITKEEYEYYIVQGNPCPFELENSEEKSLLPKPKKRVPMPKVSEPLEEGYNYFAFNKDNVKIEVKLSGKILKKDDDYKVLDKGIKIINNDILELLKNDKKRKISVKWYNLED